MKVFTGYLEPPGRGSRVEASAEYLAEDRSMADISRLLEADDLPPPLDMRAYTATLRLGFWVAHVERPHLVVSGSVIWLSAGGLGSPSPASAGWSGRSFRCQ